MYDYLTPDRPAFNGMNGTIMVNTTREGLAIGAVSGADYGYHGFDLRVTVDVRVERQERQESYETVEHDSIVAPYDFTITTSVWLPNRSDIIMCGRFESGEDPSVLRNLKSYLCGWDAEKVTALAELEAWHLNGMQAACAHMPNLITEERYGRQVPVCGGVNVCEAGSGYTYGRSWLTRPLPESFVPDLIALFGSTDALEQHRVYVHPDLNA